jgi:hypothetical protein
VAGTAANDTITAAAGTLQASDVISDASTTDADVLNLSINSYSSVQALISSVETINVAGVYTSSGLDAQNVVNAKTVNLSAGISGATGTLANASAQKVQAVNAGTNIDTLNINSAAFTGGTGGTISVGAGSASTVTIGNTGNTGTDAYSVSPVRGSTLNLRGGSDGTDTFTVTLPGGGLTLDIDNLAATTGDIDNLNLVSSGSATNTITVNSGDDKITDSGTGDRLLISGTQSVTFTGDLDALVGNGTRLTNVALEKASGYTGTVTWNSNNSITSGNLNRAVGLDVINVTTTATGVNLLLNEATTLNLAINNGSRLYNVDNNTTTAMTAGSGTLKLGLTGDSATNSVQDAVSTGANVGTLVITNATRASTITTLDTTTGTTVDTVVVNGDKNLTITTWNATGSEVLTATNFTGALTATSANAAATMIGGSGADILTGGSDLADSIVGGAGDDILSGGVGSATDTLVGGLGSDRFILGGNVASAERIADFSISGTNGTDVLAISVGSLSGTSSAALSAMQNGNSANLVAGATVGISLVSAATTLTAATNVIVLSGTFATQALMETAVEAGGTRQITLGSATAAGDDYFILWSDGTNAYFGYLNDTGTATTFSAGANTTYNNVVTLAGVTSVDAITASNFLFIA